MTETSPLPEFMASKLINAHASLHNEMLRAVKTEAALEDQLAIQYSFKDTKLFQLNGADLGSGLIHYSQKMTAAAMQIADMKVWAHRS